MPKRSRRRPFRRLRPFPNRDPERLVCVAEIATAHGVRGALKLRTFTAEPENVLAYGPLLDERGEVLLVVRRVVGRWKSGLIVEAEGVADRTTAEFLRGLRLYVPRAALPEPGEDEYYHVDLIGLRVEDTEGRHLGEVLAVHDFGAGEILEYGHGRHRTRMIRFTREEVPVVDLAGGRIVVAPRPEVTVPPHSPPTGGAPVAGDGAHGETPAVFENDTAHARGEEA